MSDYESKRPGKPVLSEQRSRLESNIAALASTEAQEVFGEFYEKELALLRRARFSVLWLLAQLAIEERAQRRKANDGNVSSEDDSVGDRTKA